MSQAIYRKFRPQTFEEVLGQEHITHILKNQVKHKNIGHAYLFSGGRGTGKTSCAKIMARAVNCLNPQDGSPCNVCANCRMILEGATFDVEEMDAASNRRIDDIREIIDSSYYPPAHLKYKVVIIDEAHMITREGFNALLKILEEPPRHLIFILATTEMERIPETVRSRCQRYEFHRIQEADIIKNIRNISQELDLVVEEDALEEMARQADGAMRDALALLDQLRSLRLETIGLAQVQEVLGLISSEGLGQLVDYMMDQDRKASFLLFHELITGKSVERFMEELIFYFRQLYYAKLGALSALALTQEQMDRLQAQSRTLEEEEIQQFLSILVDGYQDLKFSPHPETQAELILLKCISRKNTQDLEAEIFTLKKEMHQLQTAFKDLYQKFIPEEIAKQIQVQGSGQQAQPSARDSGKAFEPSWAEEAPTSEDQEPKEPGPVSGSEEGPQGAPQDQEGPGEEEDQVALPQGFFAPCSPMVQNRIQGARFIWEKPIVVVKFNENDQGRYRYFMNPQNQEAVEMLKSCFQNQLPECQGIRFELEKTTSIRGRLEDLGLGHIVVEK